MKTYLLVVAKVSLYTVGIPVDMILDLFYCGCPYFGMPALYTSYLPACMTRA